MKENLSTKKEQIVFGDDAVVIQKYNSGIKGGRTLDMTDYPLKVVKAGHVIVTKEGVYKPMPLKKTSEKDSDGNDVYAYGTLPEGYSYAGVLYRTIPADKPAASVMFDGEVNSEVVPYPMDDIMVAFKAVCPLVSFIKDEEA